jgi:HTH-type transcriptional regulator, competence development regulator
MKIEFTKEWCLRMADLEAQASAVDAGIGVPAADLEKVNHVEASTVTDLDPNIAFGRFVRLMRRNKKLSLEKLAEDAQVEVTELVEIEEDARHRPDPRTVFQLAHHFGLPTSKLMQLAGLRQPKDNRLFEEAVRFAARSDPVESLSKEERAALEAFVSVLSEKSR